RLAPERAVRGRADRQSRLVDEQRRAEPPAGLGRRARPDDRDGHARPPGGGTGRPHPLPRRRPDRQGSPRVDRGRGAGRHAGGVRTMKRVALKGLLGRKTRAILTALAIVLGVAMVSGTFVLTDTIDRAFHTIFTSSYSHTDAIVSGKKLVDYSFSGNASVPASLVAKVRSLPDVDAAAGTILDFSGNSDQ